jgi:plasmid maintenance system killer protein
MTVKVGSNRGVPCYQESSSNSLNKFSTLRLFMHRMDDFCNFTSVRVNGQNWKLTYLFERWNVWVQGF